MTRFPQFATLIGAAKFMVREDLVGPDDEDDEDSDSDGDGAFPAAPEES